MAQQTDPLASGMATSEGRLTVALCILGVALEAFAAVLTEKVGEFPDVKWIAIAALVVGATVQVLSVLGYTKNRSGLKANVLVQSVAAGLPVVVTAISQAVLPKLPTGVREQAKVAAGLPVVTATNQASPEVRAAAQGGAASRP